MTELASDQLAELIEKKHRVLVELRNVGYRQAELVQQGEISALLKLLAAKQQMINGLQTVERSLVPFREQDPESRKWRTTEDRARCAQQAEECNQLLNDVLLLERECEDRMVNRRDEVAARLQRVRSSEQVCGAYAAHQTRNTGRATTGPQPDLHDAEADAEAPESRVGSSPQLDLTSTS